MPLSRPKEQGLGREFSSGSIDKFGDFRATPVYLIADIRRNDRHFRKVPSIPAKPQHFFYSRNWRSFGSPGGSCVIAKNCSAICSELNTVFGLIWPKVVTIRTSTP